MAEDEFQVKNRSATWSVSGLAESGCYTAMLVRSIASIAILLTLTGCDGGRGVGSSTRSRLETAVTSNAAFFDFAADTSFAWNRVYIFDCYSSRASVENALGFSWPDFSSTQIESSDSVVLVVFVQNGKVVGWYEQPRSIELGGLANGKGYSRSEAVFNIDRSTGKIELMFRNPKSTRSGRNRVRMPVSRHPPHTT